MLAILLMAGVLGFFILGSLNRARLRAHRVCCNCSLKQVGLAFRQWALDNYNTNPMGLSTNSGGTMEHLATGETFRHFQVLSNELNTAIILTCPSDSRRPVKQFGWGFSNTNVSYFVGVVTNDELPQMFLSGDRNITVGTRLATGIVELSTDHIAALGEDLHRSQGNVALADGSVQGFSDSRLREALANTGVATNRLAIP